jgi:signal transduction histidine kinase
LRQVTQNLLVNATKFTPEGGTITLRAREENGSIVVEVQDTGYGIPEEEQRRLFRPYHRQIGDREHLSGLGLGLALCKNLVQLHGGRIWVRSQEGKGSTFSFSIPINSRAQQAGTTI